MKIILVGIAVLVGVFMFIQYLAYCAYCRRQNSQHSHLAKPHIKDSQRRTNRSVASASLKKGT